ncbi:molybdopterin-dependent oxidoreductase [Sandarakinorhabdus oryzae]|uniref:molybdopterin-dependent oxidoreductase n=1 Tax=Sandarakinorhabdus oryzae TaxID=2675220 RepID=UPI0012E1027C|nr:molybdopterin-dependent oxidoreductase [Sandarakinorhabdus oryzae]
MILARRQLLTAVPAGLMLTGCDALTRNSTAKAVVESGEQATYRWQRLAGRDGLAREFSAADISPNFKVNGTHEPTNPEWQRLAAGKFTDWRLKVTGLVQRELSLSLPQLRALPQRTQITRHDCVEGWSAIGQWTGPQLAHILKASGLRDGARYIVFLCADDYGGEPAKGGLQSKSRYYESIDLVDAVHPQTILAHSLNGQPLSTGNGAPVRLRVERQLGYKQAKYLMQIVVADSLAPFGGGKGGYWPDRGYEWFAGT